jgi:hypothetical protein
MIQLVKSDIVAYLKSKHLEVLFNERDFQMHLATYLKETGHYDDVDLEYYVPTELLNGYKDLWNTELRLDLLLRKGIEYCPIELKYKTKSISSVLKRFGEDVGKITVLKNQGAQDLGMYDFWKDVKRVEMIKSRFASVKSGIALFLTNDKSYLKQPGETANTREFSMFEGDVSKSKHWLRETSITQSRKGFDLVGNYHIAWDDAMFGGAPFKYCMIEI